MSSEHDAKQTPSTTVGSPVWLEIPALDVGRCKAFFADALGWQFQPASDDYPEDVIALINFVDPNLPRFSGGIVKTCPTEHRAGTGASVTYYLVLDIVPALAKIEKAGGKTVMEKKPEGTFGHVAKFADTEGNVHGLFMPNA